MSPRKETVGKTPLAYYPDKIRIYLGIDKYDLPDSFLSEYSIFKYSYFLGSIKNTFRLETFAVN